MTDYTGQERRATPPPREDGWHLDKKVPLSLIAAMVAQVVVVTMFFADIKRDVELLKADVSVLHQKDTETTRELRDALQHIRVQYDKLNDKLDRLIEGRRK